MASRGGWLLIRIILAAPLAAQADMLKWSPQVDPNLVTLECRDTRSVPDEQTRDEIARRTGLVGRVNEIAQQIAGMRAAGYRSNGGSGGNERFSYEVPVRLSYARPMEFRIKAATTGMTLGARRLDGRFRAAVPPQAEPHLSPRVKARIEQLKVQWLAEANAATDSLRGQLHEKAFPWNGAEREALRQRSSGSFARVHAFNFCRNNYRLRLRADWRREIDDRLGER
jgi:hypothetical protein